MSKGLTGIYAQRRIVKQCDKSEIKHMGELLYSLESIDHL